MRQFERWKWSKQFAVDRSDESWVFTCRVVGSSIRTSRVVANGPGAWAFGTGRSVCLRQQVAAYVLAGCRCVTIVSWQWQQCLLRCVVGNEATCRLRVRSLDQRCRGQQNVTVPSSVNRCQDQGPLLCAAIFDGAILASQFGLVEVDLAGVDWVRDSWSGAEVCKAAMSRCDESWYKSVSRCVDTSDRDRAFPAAGDHVFDHDYPPLVGHAVISPAVPVARADKNSDAMSSPIVRWQFSFSFFGNSAGHRLI